MQDLLPLTRCSSSALLIEVQRTVEWLSAPSLPVCSGGDIFDIRHPYFAPVCVFIAST